jgi:hypothetical protein
MLVRRKINTTMTAWCQLFRLSLPPWKKRSLLGGHECKFVSGRKERGISTRENVVYAEK